MNYTRIYETLIQRSKERLVPEGYVEHHHIVPRCLGGTDEKENIAILTPEEHFVAHQLLLKMYPDNHALIKACKMMTVPPKGSLRKNKLYGWLKRRYALECKRRITGENNPNYRMHFITNGVEVKRTSKDDIIPEGWIKGKRCSHCRKCNKIINLGSKWCDLHRYVKNTDEEILHVLQTSNGKSLCKLMEEGKIPTSYPKIRKIVRENNLEGKFFLYRKGYKH